MFGRCAHRRFSVSGTTMPVGDWSDQDLHAYRRQLGGSADQPVDPLLDSAYEDITAVTGVLSRSGDSQTVWKPHCADRDSGEVTRSVASPGR
jgi:hypothetical protein